MDCELVSSVHLSSGNKLIFNVNSYNLLSFSSEGATRSHLDLFKKHRAARIDHYVIEVNKLIIRLEKVCLQKPVQQH